MTNEHLDLSGFRDALATLETALSALEGEPDNAFIRDATIKRFEYCYEFATKMITRHLSLTEDDPIAVKSMSFQDKIRRSFELGIIPNSWDKWWQYRNERNAAAHGYSKDRANELVAQIPEFFHEARALLSALEEAHEA